MSGPAVPSTSQLIPGTGTARISMVLSGLLDPSELKSDYIATKEDSRVCLPVMCFVIQKDDKAYIWDLGLPADFDTAINPSVRARWKLSPTTLRSLPDSLPPSVQSRLAGAYLSHYHWDHCGDVLSVPPHVPVYVGPGTIAGISSGKVGINCGSVRQQAINRLGEWPVGKIDVLGLKGGNDVFADGSFVVVPAAGHCAGHCIAVVRTKSSPDTYIVLGGDSGHNQALYVPCPCHGTIAAFPSPQTLHSDVSTAQETLSQLTALHERPDTWVLLAHEYEALPVVPQDVDLGDWQDRGYKEGIAQVRRHFVKLGCHAG